MKCIAVVVSYNSWAELPGCLRSLAAQRDVDLEIHVVDNASRDGSAALVRERFPEARVVANPDNVGFARANNQILSQGQAPYFALVNPDTILPPDAISTCLDFLQRNPRAGIVGTPLVSPLGGAQPTCQPFLGLWNLFEETFLLDRITGRDHVRAPLRGTMRAPERPTEAEWLSGAFLVVREDMIREVGGFDPDFFMYAEEMDWCYRARRAGWSVVYLPGPPVVHIGGASSRPIAGPMFVENLKGRVRFLHKHRSPIVTLLGRALVTTSVMLRVTAGETQQLLARAAGKQPSDALLHRLTIFRAARRWVLRGLPLTPPELESAVSP